MLKVFHACKNQGDDAYIQKNAPFLSVHTSEKPKWLTEGYYFWLGTDFYAKSWSYSQVNGNVIIRYKLNLSYDKPLDIFDLVGNPEHQYLFNEYAKAYIEEKNRREANNNKKITKPVVPEVIEKMRRNSKFASFKSIKCVDNRRKGVDEYKFSENSSEGMIVNNPIQICVFKENRKTIEFEEITHRGLQGGEI